MSTSPAPAKYLISGYVPLLSLTIIASACFGVLAVAFCYRFWRTRTHRWMLCLVIGTITMTIGFLVRIPMTNDPYSLIIYIVTTLLTLLSPCAFLAHIYLILPRLATYLSADNCLFLKPRLIARTFVWIDVTVFLLQAAGGGMTAISDVGIANAGSKCVSFGTFCALAIVFAFKLHNRYPHKWTSSNSYGKPATTWRNDWRVLYYAMLFSCVFILIRCAFRVAEFAQGYNGELRTTEWYIYTFDTLPIFIAILIWAIIWPPAYLGDNERSDLYTETGAQSDDSHMAMRTLSDPAKP